LGVGDRDEPRGGAGWDGLPEQGRELSAAHVVGRLLHHAHLCVTGGDSVRLAQASAGLGVVPLTPTAADDGRPAVPSSVRRRG